MADRIVQPKVLVSTNPDTYDNLIMQQAQNATNVTTNINGNAISDIFESNGTTVKNATNADNAIKKTDNTYGGLMLDENGILKFGNIIIPQKRSILSSPVYVSSAHKIIPLSESLKSGDIIEVEVELTGTTDDTRTGKLLKFQCFIPDLENEDEGSDIKINSNVLAIDIYSSAVKFVLPPLEISKSNTQELSAGLMTTITCDSAGTKPSVNVYRYYVNKIYKIIE